MISDVLLCSGVSDLCAFHKILCPVYNFYRSFVRLIWRCEFDYKFTDVLIAAARHFWEVLYCNLNVKQCQQWRTQKLIITNKSAIWNLLTARSNNEAERCSLRLLKIMKFIRFSFCWCKNQQPSSKPKMFHNNNLVHTIRYFFYLNVNWHF